MAKLVFGMMQSLDGNVDNMEFAPGPALFRHFIEEVRGLTGCVYGRRRYEIMRFWDEDHPDWVGGTPAYVVVQRIAIDLEGKSATGTLRMISGHRGVPCLPTVVDPTTPESTRSIINLPRPSNAAKFPKLS
jgi:hypothetical protein